MKDYGSRTRKKLLLGCFIYTSKSPLSKIPLMHCNIQYSVIVSLVLLGSVPKT